MHAQCSRRYYKSWPLPKKAIRTSDRVRGSPTRFMDNHPTLPRCACLNNRPEVIPCYPLWVAIPVPTHLRLRSRILRLRHPCGNTRPTRSPSPVHAHRQWNPNDSHGHLQYTHSHRTLTRPWSHWTRVTIAPRRSRLLRAAIHTLVARRSWVLWLCKI